MWERVIILYRIIIFAKAPMNSIVHFLPVFGCLVDSDLNCVWGGGGVSAQDHSWGSRIPVAPNYGVGGRFLYTTPPPSSSSEFYLIKNVSSSTSHKKTLSVFMSVRESMKMIAGTSCTNTLEWFSPLCNFQLHAVVWPKARIKGWLFCMWCLSHSGLCGIFIIGTLTIMTIGQRDSTLEGYK